MITVLAIARSIGSSHSMSANCGSHIDSSKPESSWVSSKLEYKTTSSGDKIMDFSYAGYGGGKSPDIPSDIYITVINANTVDSVVDNTRAIQEAIDNVSAKELIKGYRGIIELGPGNFYIDGTLSIKVSGIVLRGSKGKTVLKCTGDPRTIIDVKGNTKQTPAGPSANIIDKYVPSGAVTVTVDKISSGLEVGSTVIVERIVTEKWIKFMGMNNLSSDEKTLKWIKSGQKIVSERKIKSIQGNVVTFDIPLSDPMDSKYMNKKATVTPVTISGRISDISIEDIEITTPDPPGGILGPISKPLFEVVSIDGSQDVWISNIKTQNFISGIRIHSTTKRVTIKDCSFQYAGKLAFPGKGLPFIVSIQGSEVLVQNINVEMDNVFTVATQAFATGPNVVLNATIKGEKNSIQPHQRWATGFLVDGGDLSKSGGAQLVNRGTFGSGHGWAIGFGVLWNVNTSSYTVQKPPGSDNWAIGVLGQKANPKFPGPEGTIESSGSNVNIKSLYLAQLCSRTSV